MPWAFPAPAARSRRLVNSYRRGGYSSRRNGLHWAIDIPAKRGSRALAIRNARVVATGKVWGRAYGKQILLRYRTRTGQRRYAFYAHLDNISVQRGQRVKKGQTIGRVGSTGNSSGPHIHFEWGYSPNWDMKRYNPYRQLEKARCALVGCR